MIRDSFYMLSAMGEVFSEKETPSIRDLSTPRKTAETYLNARLRGQEGSGKRFLEHYDRLLKRMPSLFSRGVIQEVEEYRAQFIQTAQTESRRDALEIGDVEEQGEGAKVTFLSNDEWEGKGKLPAMRLVLKKTGGEWKMEGLESVCRPCLAGVRDKAKGPCPVCEGRIWISPLSEF
jgi:hypothetical protein